MTPLYKIVSQSSGKVLDVPGSSKTDGTKIQQFTDNGGTNQHWRVVVINP
jgi:mannan endo-1,4-beta-mannosidase